MRKVNERVISTGAVFDSLKQMGLHLLQTMDKAWHSVSEQNGHKLLVTEAERYVKGSLLCVVARFQIQPSGSAVALLAYKRCR